MQSLMKRRWLWLACACIAALVLIGMTGISIGHSPPEDRSSEIKVGMSRGDVDDIVADRWTSDAGVAVFCKESRLWNSGIEAVSVEFDAQDKVVKVSRKTGSDRRSLWQRIQDEYRHQKHRLTQ